MGAIRYFELMTESLPPVAILLREARGAYDAEIRQTLAARGFDPLATNGAFVLGALHYEMTRDDSVRPRGRTLEKSHTLDRLIEAGYVDDVEGEFRLSERGHACAHAVVEATSKVTAQLNEALGDEEFGHFLTGLITLIEMKEAVEES
jgi:hypothetical protein